MRVWLRCFLLVGVLLWPGIAYNATSTSKDVAIQIIPTGSVSVPAGASAAGFSTLALNGDFSQGIDLGCWPGQDNQAHTWYQGIWYAGGYTAPCSNISLVFDPVAGKQVLDIAWHPQDVATYGATMITTINQSHDRVTDFPSGYYEAIFRVQSTPNVVGLGSTWWNAWMWGTTQAQQGSSIPVVEYDIMENHGEFPIYLTSGCINWGLGGPGAGGCNFTYESFRSGFDYRQYHSYGYRITSNGTNQAVCGYFDNVLQGCTPVTLTGVENIQRNFLMASIGYGCNFVNGFGNCQDSPISNLFSCPAPYSGQICFNVPSSPCCGTSFDYQTNNPFIYVSGVQGVSQANGVWQTTAVDYPGQNTWVLEGSSFSGAWTPGTGRVNSYVKIDMYLQSFRVWSCAQWATTMCYGPVLSGAP